MEAVVEVDGDQKLSTGLAVLSMVSNAACEASGTGFVNTVFTLELQISPFERVLTTDTLPKFVDSGCILYIEFW